MGARHQRQHREAESVVFVVSTHSLASEYCAAEFRHAQERGKRIVPIACDGAEPEAAQPGLRQLNWIWCREGDDREAAFAKLSSALDTDLDWARAHTRLLVRAVDWDTRKDSSLLLRGRDLAQAEGDLAANAAKEPTPTELQQRYVLASRRAASRRQRTLLGGVLAALAVSVALGVVALLQRNTANDRARIARSQALAARAEGALATEPVNALAESVEAVETSPTAEAGAALRRSILANPIEYVIPAGRDDRRVASNLGDVWRGALGFSADGKLLAARTPAGSLRTWRSADGRPAARTIPRSAAPRVSDPASAVSTDGRHVARIVNGSAELWSKHPRRRIARLGPAERVLFSRDGRLLVTVGETGDANVWRSSSGRLTAALPGFGSLHPAKGGWTTPFNPGAAFSPDGRLLAVAAADGIVRVWELATSKQVGAAAMGWANALAFAPHGGLLAAMTWDGDVVVARAPASVALQNGVPPGRVRRGLRSRPQLGRQARRRACRRRRGRLDRRRRAAAAAAHAGPPRRSQPASPPPPSAATGGLLRRARPAAVARFGSEQRFWTAVWHPGSRTPFRRLPQADRILARPERLAHCHRRKGVADGDRRTGALPRRDCRAQPGRTSGPGAAPRDPHDRAGRLGSGRGDARRARGIQARRRVGDLQPGRSPHRHAGRHPASLGRHER